MAFDGQELVGHNVFRLKLLRIREDLLVVVATQGGR
jgi:hypothetical protein